MDEIEYAFKRKVKHLDEKKWEELDERWVNNVMPTLEEFYGGYHPKGREAKEKKQRYLDYLYMYYILHPSFEWDERYDQSVFSNAIKYANKKERSK